MKKAIGILGGMGPLATADLFRKIVLLTQADCDNDHIHIYIDSNTAIPDRTAAILSGGEDPLPQLAASAAKLTDCGADCLVLPCNTAHYFLPRLRRETATPILSMLEATAKTCKAAYPHGVAAVLGTRGTLASGVYAQALEAEGVPYLLPNEAEQTWLMEVIYDGVKAGRPMETVGPAMERVVAGLLDRGAAYFILGCTELPLAAAELKLPQPCVDPTAELAKAAIRWCGYSVKA